MKKKTLIMFMGPPGVGKTPLVEYLQKKIVGSIAIQKKNIELNNPKNNVEEWNEKYYEVINRMFQMSDCVILDTHHVLEKDRWILFNHLNLPELKIIGIWVENSWNNILINNNNKPKNQQLNEKALKYLFDYRSSPSTNEPFDDLVYLILNADIAMSKSHPYLTTVQEALDKI